MPIKIKCKNCGNVLFEKRRANIYEVLSDLKDSECPKCKRKLEMPDLSKLEIEPLKKNFKTGGSK